mgnify:FL=1
MRSSPGPKTGCSSSTMTTTRGHSGVLRSSPGPKTGCSCDLRQRGAADQSVAILTRSEDRVQHVVSGAGRPDPSVAILTRSEDRVQRINVHGISPDGHRCDPHPVRRPGAASRRRALGSGAGPVAILTRSEDRVQPCALVRVGTLSPSLRSSPGPKTGCSAGRPGWRAWHCVVAILTRSEDRVQRACGGAPRTRWLQLRSSPGPKTGCSDALVRRALRGDRCDPHPVRRPGAAHISRATRAEAEVAILTRSEDRVQHSPPERVPPASRSCDPHPVRRPGAARYNAT